MAARFGFECWRQAWSTAPVHGGADGIEPPFYLNTAGHPVVLGEIVLAAALLEGLTEAKLDTYRGSMHRFFENTHPRADTKSAGEA